jgi:hypothetical protein
VAVSTCGKELQRMHLPAKSQETKIKEQAARKENKYNIIDLTDCASPKEPAANCWDSHNFE